MTAAPPADAFADDWSWASRAAPELARYRPLDLQPLPLQALLAWVAPGVEATLFDRECRPIRATRTEGALSGSALEKTTVRGRRKRVEATSVEFGVEVAWLGSGWTDYERGPAGGWSESGSGGTGCLSIPPGVLARVTRDAAFWSGARVALRAGCVRKRRVVEPCLDREGDRECTNCDEVGFEVQSLAEGFGSGLQPAIASVVRAAQPVDCSKPCPPDELAGTLERINALLGGRRLLLPDAFPGGPVLFRTRGACERHSSRDGPPR